MSEILTKYAVKTERDGGNKGCAMALIPVSTVIKSSDSCFCTLTFKLCFPSFGFYRMTQSSSWGSFWSPFSDIRLQIYTDGLIARELTRRLNESRNSQSSDSWPLQEWWGKETNLEKSKQKSGNHMIVYLWLNSGMGTVYGDPSMYKTSF